MGVDTSHGKESMDEQRFNELYQAYAGDVLRVSYYYLGDRQKAEDVTQDVFVKLLTANPNRCRDLWRESWFRRVVLGSPQLETKRAPDRLEDEIERQELREAVRRLSPGFREVVLLHYFQGLGIAEISRMLNLPEGTISSRLSRARKKLEEMLKESEHGEER